MRVFLRDILTTVVLAVVIFFGLQATIQKYVIWEICMEPNFYDGQQVLVNKIIYKFQELTNGDIIILHPPSPYDPKATPFIKRIIAIPGQTVEVKNGEVYVDGQKLYEPYIKEPPTYPVPLKTIPENEYFVLGDNRNNANDSHTGWTVPRQNIIGKAWLSYWPLSRWGLVSNYHLQEQIDSLANSK